MIVKYGKPINFLELGRDLRYLREAGHRYAALCERMAKLESVIVDTCPVCRSTLYVPIASINGFAYRECGNCGHVYLQEYPADLYAIYEKSSEQKALYISETAFRQRCAVIAAPKAAFINQAAERNEAGLWLDLGCATGELLMEAAALGWRTLGFDADQEEVRFAVERGLNVKAAFLDMMQLDASIVSALREADVVSLLNILEHVEDPCLWLQTLHSHMKPGALLAVEVPRAPSLTRVMNMACLSINYKYMIPPLHLHVFSESSLCKVWGMGFDPLAKWCFGNGFVDLMNTALLLSDNPHFANNADTSCFNDIWRVADTVQRTIDEQGLSDVMLWVLKNR